MPSIVKMCRWMEVSRSGFYEWRNAPESATARKRNLLISEINGSWVSEYTATGKLVWTAQLPISYPSGPQQASPIRHRASSTSPMGLTWCCRTGRRRYTGDRLRLGRPLGRSRQRQARWSGGWLYREPRSATHSAGWPVTSAIRS